MRTTAQVRFRSGLIDTQVITRGSGRRLGVVSQLWVDVDRWEVVAFELKGNLVSNYLPGESDGSVSLKKVRQIGDVVLVDDEQVIEDLNLSPFSKLVGCEVVTETGEPLGKVRDFEFTGNDGRVTHIVIDTFGVPRLPSRLLSTYELSIDEIVSVGSDKLIVFEGAEERLNQLTRGLLENLGIGRPPWEREDEDYLPPPIGTENQLGSGAPSPARRRPATSRTWQPQETWEEDVAPPPRRAPARPRPEPVPLEPEPLALEDIEPVEVWSPPPRRPEQMAREPLYEETDLEADAWAETEYQAPKVNLPERQRIPEYEDERDY